MTTTAETKTMTNSDIAQAVKTLLPCAQMIMELCSNLGFRSKIEPGYGGVLEKAKVYFLPFDCEITVKHSNYWAAPGCYHNEQSQAKNNVWYVTVPGIDGKFALTLHSCEFEPNVPGKDSWTTEQAAWRRRHGITSSHGWHGKTEYDYSHKPTYHYF